VEAANKYAVDVLELEEQPAILQNTIKKMGLKDVKGLKILEGLEEGDRGEDDWLEEEMIEGGSKKKYKNSKWEEDQTWYTDADQDWYGKKGKKKKSAKGENAAGADEYKASKKNKSGKKDDAYDGYTKAEWEAWETKQKEKKEKKKAKKANIGTNAGDAGFFAAEDGDDDLGDEQEQYLDEETGEIKFRPKARTGKKSPGEAANGGGAGQKKDKWADESGYTQAEWDAWEAEKKAKKAAKKAAKEKEQASAAAEA